ncbi:MAG: hypothetical protein LC624_06965 [Halobacteriales archaeon]|nr:hypothetical protein [Halobacteriales archaeon]
MTARRSALVALSALLLLPALLPSAAALAEVRVPLPHAPATSIEASLAVLHVKLDRLVEDAAVARTDIAWLKWGVRLLFAAVAGVGGVAAHAAM